MTSQPASPNASKKPTHYGRPSKPYRTSWGEEVLGLYRNPARLGYWRVVATGESFTEHDERRAIHRFREMTRAQTALVNIPLHTIPPADQISSVDPNVQTAPEFNTATEEVLKGMLDTEEGPNGEIIYLQRVDEVKLWAWVRQQLINQPEYVAKMTGIPEVAGLRYLPLPKAPIKLAELFTVYESRNGGKDETKAATRRIWDLFIKHTEAVVLDDLTTAKLQAYVDTIEKSVTAPGTRKLYYSKIKTVIAFGLKCGLNAEQIRAALDRAKVLWTSQRIAAPKPTPISRKDFHALLDFTNTHPWGVWRGWLLVGLNLCLHIGEVCELTWDEFDFNGGTTGTYCCIRAKTEEHRIPRAATLWPETIEVLRELKAGPRKGPYVFTSHYGTFYNRNKRVNSFKEFRDAAGLPYITFDSIRDGAYTAACQLCPDERWARLLAGHKSPGLQDSYVLRNPEIVRPACEAVYKAYGPFPVPAKTQK